MVSGPPGIFAWGPRGASLVAQPPAGSKGGAPYGG